MNAKNIQILMCLFVWVAFTHGKVSAQEKQAVVIFNNTKIYPSDIQLDKALRAKKEKELDAEAFRRFEFTYRMNILAKLLHQHIVDRILAENYYKSSAEEYGAFVTYFKNMRKNPYAKIDDAKKIEIQAQIRTWHFDSILYNKYGGKVIATPEGYKPVEAYKALVDELMSSHVLIFSDIEHRGALTELYTYFQGKNQNYVSDELAQSYFHRPFWGDFGIKDTQNALKEKYKAMRYKKRTQPVPAP